MNYKGTAVLCLLSISLTLVSSSRLEKFIGENDYDKTAKPEDDGPVNVEVSLLFTNPQQTDAAKQTIQFAVTNRLEWTDSRLKGQTFNINCPKDIAKLWVPDTYFPNALTISPVLNEALRIKADGSVWLSRRFTIELPCSSNHHSFPMDTMECAAKFSTYGSTTDDVIYSLKKTWVSNDSSTSEIRHVETETSNTVLEISSGKYAEITVTMRFDRIVGRYVTDYFIPSILGVLIAYLAFYIKERYIISRLILASISILIHLLISYEVKSKIPMSNVTMSLDVWIGFGFLFTLISILGSIYKHVRDRRYNEHSNSDDDNPHKRQYERVSHFGQLLFPVAYVGFVIIFWIAYSV